MPSFFPAEPDPLAHARAVAEGLSDDETLAAWRDLEDAARGLPSVIDGVRRTRLVEHDVLATTWEGWQTNSGQRTLLRCLRPRFARDPLVHRHLVAALARVAPTPALAVCKAHLDGDWPHAQVRLDGVSLHELLPLEDAPDPAWLARLLGRLLQGAISLHTAGIGLPSSWPRLLHIAESGPRLAWLGTLRSPDPEPALLSTIARALDTPEQDGEHELSALLRVWRSEPPPALDHAEVLLQSRLGTWLGGHRHALAQRASRVGRQDRLTRLSVMVARLRRAMPPPATETCLRSDKHGVLVVARSDGTRVWGGSSSEARPVNLPLVFDPDKGLIATASRPLLRAWATRRSGNETVRAEVLADLGSTEAHADALVRWLSGRARLRAATLLLRHEQATPPGPRLNLQLAPTRARR